MTVYFLCIAIGGVFGGVFVTVFAPLIFNGYWELHISLVACVLLILSVIRKEKEGVKGSKKILIKRALYYVPVLLLAAILVLHPLQYHRNSVFSDRNFYGAIRVERKKVKKPPSNVHFLMYGITTHGFQFTENEYRDVPTCYYGAQSGAGIALLNHPNKLAGKGLKVAAVGLGIGTVAAYGQEGDFFHFIEINPKIIDLAEGKNGYFTYLADTEANYEILTGDGRLVLEQLTITGIAPPDRYDVLILDAFSSDAVPIHLLTKEAFALYFNVLKDDGILAAHTSNRTLAVAWVIIKQAMDEHIPSAVIITDGNPYTFSSEWTLITNNASFLKLPDVAENIVPYELFAKRYRLHLWTDRYSNIFEIIK